MLMRRNIMSKKIKYNLPGYGFATCLVFDATEKYLNLFEENGLIEKSKKVSQLGVMKYIYPGAHHTRYEYIFTQMMLISNIVISKGTVQRNVEISLGSDLAELKADDIFYKQITGGDILQTLPLLSNLGYMYDTFAASKNFLKALQKSKQDNTKFYDIYRRNLPREIHGKFNEMLTSGNYYKLHLYNMIHLIKGMGNKSENRKICDYAVKLLTYLIDETLIKNEATKRIFFLYKKIRKIAYLSVDMIYTPASFGVNLNRMVYEIPSYIDDLFNEDSVINNTIAQLEDIIHKQIYDSPMCILNTTKIESENEQKFYKSFDNVNSIHDIRRIIKEDSNIKLHTEKQPDILKKIVNNSELILSGKEFPFVNWLNYDKTITTTLPLSRILFGTQASQNLEKLYFAFGIASEHQICIDCQTIINKSIAGKMYASNEKINLIKYAIKSIYEYNKFFFNLTVPEGTEFNQCVFIGNGCKTVANQIRSTFSNKNVKNVDQLHEILSCATVLEEISYAGSVMCYVGGIKASQYNKSEKLDEIDGFIYFPSRKKGEPFAFIIEAKNYPSGENDAEKQLSDTIPFLSHELNNKIIKLNKCAYMELTIKDN